MISFLSCIKTMATTNPLPHEVYVGQGATYSIGSDSYPYTVIEMSANGRTIVLQKDTTERAVPGDPTSEWVHKRNPEGKTMKATWRPRLGYYRESGSKCGHITLGSRVYYLDPSF